MPKDSTYQAVAIATDLAEVVGGAIAMNLLFGVPVSIGVAIAAVVSRSAALAFALALLASGLTASAVGTYAGQIVMEGFLRRRIPLPLRRVITIAPALLILMLGFDPTSHWSGPSRPAATAPRRPVAEVARGTGGPIRPAL